MKFIGLVYVQNVRLRRRHRLTDDVAIDHWRHPQRTVPVRCLLKQRRMEVTNKAISPAKLQSNHHHRQTNTQLFTGRMPFLSPNQQRKSTEGKNITFHGLAYPKLTWGRPTLSLTINFSTELAKNRLLSIRNRPVFELPAGCGVELPQFLAPPNSCPCITPGINSNHISLYILCASLLFGSFSSSTGLPCSSDPPI